MKRLIYPLLVFIITACGAKAETQENSAEPAHATEVGTSVNKKTAAPDFTLNDINGKPLSLSDLRGKWVILDFWGAWCPWCIKGFPALKDVYKEYNGKIEILGIDCRDTEDAWKEAVKKYELPWLQVYNPGDNDLLEKYQIKGFPTKFIIDPDGNIANATMGEKPEFFDALKSLVK